MNFDFFSNRLSELYKEIYPDNNSGKLNSDDKDLMEDFNIAFQELVKCSTKELKYFSGCSIAVFKNHINNRISYFKENDLDFSEVEYIKKWYNKLRSVKKSIGGRSLRSINNEFYYEVFLNKENHNILQSKIIKRLEYVELELFKRGVEVVKQNLEFAPEFYFKDNFEQKLKYETESQKTVKKDNYKNKIWFKVGLEFAKGAAQKLYSLNKDKKGHFKIITDELGFKPTDRPYFSETIGNHTDRSQNIYNDFNKTHKIFQHCQDNNISVVEDFTNQYNKLQVKH